MEHGWVGGTEQSNWMPIAGKSTAHGGSEPTQNNSSPQPKEIPTLPSPQAGNGPWPPCTLFATLQ